MKDVVLVVVGALAGLAGSIAVEVYRTKREHRRWLLDQRYETYVSVLVRVEELLTWARNESVSTADAEAPAGPDFTQLQARIALVGSPDVRSAWGDLDKAFAPFWGAHPAAASAARKARSSGHVDSDEAIRLRLRLDAIVTEARQRQMQLSQAMERDVRGQRS